ncbi:5'-nucleotidase C-terminal domain-containing protein [Rhizobium halophytocola]|uniref:5'-nucleotidase n=1 Tax=Rhizobium halophytocola TaxID=735519 RepID=A0ABS4DTA7_9HYPH|nr:5'-nucleotidase C-terminal domain-containing protein [Rhizobium halophytocola]MBP1848919.1 5'-nucleotidase [Rhizobium halophytocola]
MLKILQFGLLSASVLAISASTAFADFELHILHNNDFHSRIESINKYDSTCASEDDEKGECFGGAARFITAIKETRKSLEGQNVILLNAGDNFQGSLFYTTYKGAAEAEFMNMMGFDAMTIGNHEFDDSEDGLKGFLDKVKFPVVSANVLPGYSSKIGDQVKPSIVLDVGGQKIGIVGAVANDTDELSSPGPNIMIAEDVATITAQVEKLKGEGVDKIIALTHVGYPRDLAAIAKIPDIDVVVGGHSHSLLSNTDEKAEGPYPTMVDNPGGYKVPVVQAGAYSKYLGNLDVVFDDSGVVKSASGDPILVDAKFKPDEAAAARVKELAGPIEELKTKEIGETEGPVEGSRDICRAEECSMGDLVADAMVDRVKDQGVTIAFQNGGGLRASIDAGTVTMGEVLTVLPFQNTLATFELKGADIVAALENGLSQIEEGAGRFPQVSGLKLTYDKSKPAGSRVVSVEVKEGDGFTPLEMDKTYKVATNNFMRTGGDGYSVFEAKGMNAYDYGPGLETVVADYIAKNSPYKPYTDGRIVEAAAAGADAPKADEPVEKPADMTPAEAPATDAKKDAEAPAPAPAPAAEITTPDMPDASATLANSVPPIPTENPAKAAQDAKPAEPAMPAADSAMASGDKKTHTVAKGESLWIIAKEAYGDGHMWTMIAKANRLKSPHALMVGQELVLPAK